MRLAPMSERRSASIARLPLASWPIASMSVPRRPMNDSTTALFSSARSLKTACVISELDICDLLQIDADLKQKRSLESTRDRQVSVVAPIVQPLLLAQRLVVLVEGLHAKDKASRVAVILRLGHVEGAQQGLKGVSEAHRDALYFTTRTGFCWTPRRADASIMCLTTLTDRAIDA